MFWRRDKIFFLLSNLMHRSGHSIESVFTELLKIYFWMIFSVDGGRGHSLYEHGKRLANPKVFIFIRLPETEVFYS